MSGIVPNTSMMIVGGGEVSRLPADWRTVLVKNVVVVGERQRPIDPKMVEQLCESFQLLGQIAPIGVKRQASGQPFRLIYGHHRLEAKRKLLETDPSHDSIAATIYPEEMEDWACEAHEVAENLCRKELTPKERDAHTAIYAGLLKQHGAVVNRREAQGQAQSQSKGAIPKSLGHSLPTVTRKTAGDLGVTDEAVRNRIKNASKLAARNGIAVAKATPEAMSGDELLKVGHAALKVAQADRAEAVRVGKSPRYSAPLQPTKPTISTVRIDVTDPAPFIAWCRTRIAGKRKPMSLDILKAYADALVALIKEIEAS